MMYLLRLAGLLGLLSLLGSGAFAPVDARAVAFFGLGLPCTSGTSGSSSAFSAAALPLPCKKCVCQCETGIILIIV